MDIDWIVQRMKARKFVDVEDEQGNTIRHQLRTEDITGELVRRYLSQYDRLVVVPKTMVGNSPRRIESKKWIIDRNTVADFNGSFPIQQQNSYQQDNYQMHGLSGINQSMPMMGHNSGDNNMYKHLYEEKKSELAETKAELREERTRREKAELELATKKNSVTSDIVQGLAGVVPAMMGGANAGMLGNAPETQQTAAPQNVKPVDPRLRGIIATFNTLEEEDKQAVYEMLANVFNDISLIEQINSLITE